MAERKPKLTAPRTDKPRSAGLANAFARCPACGTAVCVQIAKTVTVEWHNPATDADELVQVLRWERYEVPRDPVCGADHPQRCPEAAGWRPLWVKDGQGGERFTWLRMDTGEIVEVAA